MISNKISDKITKASKNSQKSNLETVTNDNDKEIHKERQTSPEENTRNYWWSEINIIIS